jgi:hypothetical protein
MAKAICAQIMNCPHCGISETLLFQGRKVVKSDRWCTGRGNAVIHRPCHAISRPFCQG